MKFTQPLISIGLPVYNGENFLKEALDSILAQTFTDFELIISDNASTDRTEDICREYATKDKRIRYYRNEDNLGAANNYNRVFKLSSGKYFKWAAHDDVCAPDYLKRCVTVLEQDPSIVLCYPKANLIDKEGRDIGVYTENLNIYSFKPHERLYKLLETYGWYHGTQAFGLMRTSALQKTLLIANYAHADRVLLAELAILGRFVEVPQCLFYRRIHPQISQIANPTDETFSVWFDPKNKEKITLPKWRRYFAYCKIIQRSQLNYFEKISCYVQILKRLFISPGLSIRIKGILEELTKLVKLLAIKLQQPS